MDLSTHLNFNTPLERNKSNYLIGSNDLFKSESMINKSYFYNNEPFIELRPEINQYKNLSLEKETSYKNCSFNDYVFFKK